MIEAGDEYAELRGVMILGAARSSRTKPASGGVRRAGGDASEFVAVQPGALASAPKRVVLRIVPEKVVIWDHRSSADDTDLLMACDDPMDLNQVPGTDSGGVFDGQAWDRWIKAGRARR